MVTDEERDAARREMKDAVRALPDRGKVELLKRLNGVGVKYHPGSGALTVEDTDRFCDALTGRSGEQSPGVPQHDG